MNVHALKHRQYNDARARPQLFSGDIFTLAATPATEALVRHAARMIEEAFAPHDPRTAHTVLPVIEAVNILSRLKPRFIHDPETRNLLRDVLLDYGCDPHVTYQDVPRLRVAFPADYLTTGIAYAHHPHRDTWYSAPPGQVNWWMPVYDFTAEQGMAFHPRYWNRAVRNDSEQFNYYRWNTEGRLRAAEQIGTDTRVQPHPQEPVETDPDLRIVVPPGGTIIFSADQLHSTVPNKTALARWSIDFRTVNREDMVDRRGAPVPDCACTGTSLRDFKRTSDFAAMPAEIVALYDDGTVDQGAAVYQPLETV